MILGIGTDVLEIHRVQGALERTGARMAKRVLAPAEYALFQQFSGTRQIEFMAGRFAAKEAIGKALGIGLGRLHPSEVAVLTELAGLRVNWLGRHLGQAYTEDSWFISISHSQSTAVAFVVWEQQRNIDANVDA